MNRTRARIAVLALPLVAFGVGLGCLGMPERQYFNDLLDGGADGTVVTVDSSPPDSSLPDDRVVGDDSPVGADAPAPGDAGTDVLDGADAKDAPPDCGPMNTITNCGSCGAACDTDSGTPTGCTAGSCRYTCNAGYGDCQQGGSNTNGCETPINTTANCTGCGIACNTTSSLDASCSGTTCKYSGCAAGWSDCNNSPPNADGCECHSPGCCGDGSVCMPQHDNGVGNTYFDCSSVGSYSSALALKACTAYTGSAAQCVGFPCLNPDAGPIICSSGNPSLLCVCWSYGGTNKGLVDNGGKPPGTNAQNCFCPDLSVGDTTWN
jgi:hypothetical protein